MNSPVSPSLDDIYCITLLATYDGHAQRRTFQCLTHGRIDIQALPRRNWEIFWQWYKKDVQNLVVTVFFMSSRYQLTSSLDSTFLLCKHLFTMHAFRRVAFYTITIFIFLYWNFFLRRFQTPNSWFRNSSLDPMPLFSSTLIQLNPARADPRRTEFRLQQMVILSPNFILFDSMKVETTLPL